MNREDKETIFLQAYDAYSDSLFRYCYFKLYDRDLAKDMVQETFMRTWQEIEKGKQFGNIRAFLYTVAGNLIKDHWKRKKAVPIGQLENDNDEQNFDVADESVDLYTEVEIGRSVKLFAKLGESDREVLHLRFVEGLTPKDISRVLGERENTVSVRLNRALERLRKIINK